jgi:ribosomal protein S18 acetylase RimI-like enzyme
MGSAGDTRASDPTIALRYADTPDELDAVEPMWNALQEHHVRITPNLGPHTPERDLPDAWRMRRSKYERWLEDPETFLVLAENASGPVGYAFVTVGPGYASWATGERAGVLETLSVLPEHRSGGIGAALIEAVWSRLGEEGIDDMSITTTETNVDARRFYESQGFSQGFVVYYRKRPSR